MAQIFLYNLTFYCTLSLRRESKNKRIIKLYISCSEPEQRYSDNLSGRYYRPAFVLRMGSHCHPNSLGFAL